MVGYALAVFLHIVGALGLFAALALEWASLYNLRRVATAAQAGETGTISAGLRQQLHDPVLVLSAWVRTALGLGVIFVMAIKPGAAGSLTALGVALALGLVVGFPRGRAVARPQAS